ncbi:mis-12, partial [Pristionchus pacificus]
VMNRRERLNEDQCHFFGFSPMALGDEVYNGIVDSWEKQADELMKTPQWSKVKDGKKARVSIINILLDKGNDESLIGMCDQISEYAHLHAFKIPNHIVLPGTEPLQKMTSSDPAALRRRVMKAEKRVEEAKKRTALLRHEQQDVSERLKVIRDIARKLGYVPKEDTNSGETTMRTNVTTIEDESMMEDSVADDDNKENDENDRSTVDEKNDDTVIRENIEMGESFNEDKTMTEESMEKMMERSMRLDE